MTKKNAKTLTFDDVSMLKHIQIDKLFSAEDLKDICRDYDFIGYSKLSKMNW